MEVKLLHSTPLEIADIAICKCYGNEPHSDEAKIKARIKAKTGSITSKKITKNIVNIL